MVRRSFVVRAMVVLASLSVASGCSSRSYSTLTPVSDAVTQTTSPFIWSTKASMPTARRNLAAALVNKNVLLAIGGEQGAKDMNTVEAYKFDSDSWTEKRAMPTARQGLAVGVINGMLYAVGGSESPGPLDTVEAYDYSTDTWKGAAPMPTARRGLAAGVVNGILYAVGGDDANGHFLSVVEAYDPTTNTWTRKASMPTARSGLGVGVVNGILYAVGGQDSTGALAANEAYNPATNTWTVEPSMLTASSGLAAAAFVTCGRCGSSQLWAFGGDDGHGRFLSTVEDYNPEVITWRQRIDMPTARSGLAAAEFVRKGRPIFYEIGGYDGVDLNTVESLWLQH